MEQQQRETKVAIQLEYDPLVAESPLGALVWCSPYQWIIAKPSNENIKFQLFKNKW